MLIEFRKLWHFPWAWGPTSDINGIPQWGWLGEGNSITVCYLNWNEFFCVEFCRCLKNSRRFLFVGNCDFAAKKKKKEKSKRKKKISTEPEPFASDSNTPSLPLSLFLRLMAVQYPNGGLSPFEIDCCSLYDLKWLFLSFAYFQIAICRRNEYMSFRSQGPFKGFEGEQSLLSFRHCYEFFH